MDFEDKIWLNAASEGPLPIVSGDALKESIVWKSLPYQLDIPKFVSVPVKLKDTIARFINVNRKDVILANSASYGLHLLANGLKWNEGDEILLMQNDFPTDILPWLALKEQGVVVKQIAPKDKVLTPEELQENVTERTKLFCISHVHTFSGITLNVQSFANICRENHVHFVLNISQSAGTMPIDVEQLKVDAIVCAGYKWLLGPYGTGFAWILPELRKQLTLNRSYWVSALSEEELQSEDVINPKELQTARKLDIFGTANFFNFVPFRTSLEYLLDIGIDNIKQYHDQLIDHFLREMEPLPFTIISPLNGPSRSSLVVITHNDASKNESIHQELQSQGIYTALWKGNTRVSAHIYNSEVDLDKLVNELKQF